MIKVEEEEEEGGEGGDTEKADKSKERPGCKVNGCPSRKYKLRLFAMGGYDWLAMTTRKRHNRSLE